MSKFQENQRETSPNASLQEKKKKDGTCLSRQCLCLSYTLSLLLSLLFVISS